MAPALFSVPIFLLTYREALETGIIVSILLAFLKQTVGGPDGDPNIYNVIRRQVWLGAGIGFLICLIVAGGIIGIFYTVGSDVWSANEYYFEGAFSLLGSLVISVMGVGLLRIGNMQQKWRVKLAKALATPEEAESRQGWLKRMSEKYAMFFLPFITVLREGIEAIVFIAGVSFSSPVTSIPLAVVVGVLLGIATSYMIYRGGAATRVLLVASTCLLYVVAAGLFSRGVWFLESQQWNNVVGGDAAELGAGPGSYDIDRSVWHVNCCSPQLNGGGGWGILNGIFGWTNSATYGSVISYNVYWICVMAGFAYLRIKEARSKGVSPITGA